MAKKNNFYIIGIDEVGRGPLAGPVVVAAVAATTKFKIQKAELRIKKKPKNSKFLILNSKLAKLRDSKKLSPKQREYWFKFVKKSALCYSIASVSPQIIDRINISNAANLAATKALKRLIKNYKLRIKNCVVYLDGGLYIRVNPRNYLRLSASTIIKGDEKIPVIALASIVAKVIRDKKMAEYHKKYPRYGFAQHKGYGTKQHIKAINKFGRSPIHRKSFKIKLLKSG